MTSTSLDEFNKFIQLLPVTPYLIPIAKHSKHPDVPEKESWKDPKYKLTIEDAQKRLGQEQNIGVVATGEDIVIFDLDNPTKFDFSKETLTVKTRSGKLHKYYLNNGDVKNADGKGQYAGCGEVRAFWKYVVAPGSYVPSDKNTSDGVYRIINAKPPVILCSNELPAEFCPTVATSASPIQPLVMDGSCRNQYGWTLEQICSRDDKLAALLQNQNADYPSASEADMATLSKLLYWGYSRNEAATILRKYRYRDKLLRDDYIQGTLSKINIKDTIANHVNVKYWSPQGRQTKTKDTTETMAKMNEILQDLMLQFTFKTPIDIEEIYCYNDGVYVPAEQKVKNLIEKWLEAETTTHFVEEVLNHIRRTSYVDREEFNKAGTIIPVQNGFLNLQTLTLEPFDKNKIFTYKLNVTYDPSKKCPKFQQFLTEILESEDTPTLQEYLGYCLLPAMPYHKMMWLYGIGRNGKGRIIATLQAILGAQNCGNLNLEEFYGDRRFSVAHLYGKMINVSSEPSTIKALQTPLLKKITGEDYIDAEVKNKQYPIKFINFAKLFILGNRFPRVNDNTIAFWDRVLLIQFPRSFIGKKQIVDIEKTWVNDNDERSGILNWMIEGLARLLSQNEFSIGKKTEDTILDFKRVSDTTMAFLDEQCLYDKDGVYTRNELYDLYKEYCDAYGLTIEDERIFTGKLKQNPKIKNQYKRIEGKNSRVWTGLKVKTLNVEESDTHDTHDTCLLPLIFSDKSEEEIAQKKNDQTYVPSVSSVSVPANSARVCGSCACWHKPSCSFQGDVSCVNPLNEYAFGCRDFQVKLEKAV